MIGMQKMASGDIRRPDFFIIGAPEGGYDVIIYLPCRTSAGFHAKDQGAVLLLFGFSGYREHATLVSSMTRYLKLFSAATEQHLFGLWRGIIALLILPGGGPDHS